MNHNFKDITGEKFGRLTVKGYSHSKNKAFWVCKCECGNTVVVSGDKLRRGVTKSCGCIQEEHRRCGFHKHHGMTDSPIYTTWINMRRRCGNKSDKNYGGRGISVCKEWEQFEPFYEWAMSAGYKDGLSIERIDVNGNYCPENCKWIPLSKQLLNQRRNHRITAFGKCQTIKEWSDETGIKYDTIERRINRYGWDAERAVSVKPHKRG